nr:hypothetical protein [uncultured Desulfobacter sp.]
MNTGKQLKSSNLRKTVSKRADEIVDKRQDGKTKHSMHDSCLSALAMMFFQDPSMLEFQKRLEEASQLNNLRTMFKVTTIPKDNQMRAILDNVPSEQLFPVSQTFSACFNEAII